jgi:hypothetical protein
LTFEQTFDYNKGVIEAPVKPAPQARKSEFQALVAVVACGPRRGLVGLELISEPGARGEYFLPFSVGAEDPSDREYAYTGLTTAIDKLRSLHVDRVLIVVDDNVLIDELERRAEPPKELFLQYVIVGCKLNEFRRAKVVAAHQTRLEELRIRTKALAATIYNTVPHTAQAM